MLALADGGQDFIPRIDKRSQVLIYSCDVVHALSHHGASRAHDSSEALFGAYDARGLKRAATDPIRSRSRRRHRSYLQRRIAKEPLL